MMKTFLRAPLLLTVAVIACSLSAATGLAVETASMEDLKALSDAGRSREVLQKAESVPASKRTDEWNQIVTKAAKGFLAKAKEQDRTWAFQIGKRLSEENPHLMKDQEFAFEVGTAGSRGYSSKAVATPFFVAALTMNDERCKSADVRDSVTDAFNRSGFEKEKTAAKTILFELCAKLIDESWASDLVKSDVGVKNVCPALAKFGKLSGVKAKKCQGKGA